MMKEHLKGTLLALLMIMIIYVPIVLILKSFVTVDSLNKYLFVLITVMVIMQFIYIFEALIKSGKWFMKCGYYHFYIMIFTMIYHIIYLLISFES